MPDLLYPYLVSVVATVIVLLAALWAYITCHRRSVEYTKRAERLPLATRWADLSQKVADLREELDSLKGEEQQARAIVEEAQRERDWLDRNQDRVEQMKLERQQADRVTNELVQANEQLGRVREQMDQFEKEKAKAEFLRQQAEERCERLENQAQEQTRAIERAEADLNRLKGAAREAEERLISMRAQLGESAEAAAQAQRRVEALEREIHDLTQERNSLKKQKDELEAKASAAKAAALCMEEKALEMEVRAEQLGSRITDLRNREMELDKTLMSPETALADLWRPSVELGEYEDPESVPSESEALDQAEGYLEALGLQFPRRVLNAFHTSLKVARETPLLVLAGISGTGKSLLPRRYAEAMGIHFLTIPVQPRWDGPQDLLGFFNYLENRYKATDLTRALIQMDRFSGEWIPKGNHRSAEERMLLVLLDEMNLARVEYYFSEFLSKLEIRRDVLDPDRDQADREKAEISLDIGRFGRDRNCRIYVDTNVLFVGTMNEDESTLTLSDKVVDRANVMRFGRPPSLAVSKSPPEQEPDELRASAFLHRDTWDAWVTAGTTRTVPEEVEVWVENLNKALMRVGRPFGYRTRNAILSYVRQYPDLTEEGIRFAVADQIEQRVLPKLRGLDVSTDEAGQHAINDVKAIVQDLDDRPLLAAIEMGMHGHGGHLFTWLGCERSNDEI